MRLILFAVLLACLLPLPQGLAAAEVRAHALRVQIAERQRILLYRMASASCLVLAGIDVDRHAELAARANADFTKAITVLGAGNASLGIARFPEGHLHAQLRALRQVYAPFGAAVQQITKGDWHSVILSQVLRGDKAALAEMDQILGTLLRSGKTQDETLAGRQRMLSQRAGKALCFITLDIDARTQRADLGAASAEFDATMLHLAKAETAGRLRGPWRGIHVARIRSVWAQMTPLVRAAAQGGKITLEELDQLVRLNETLLEYLQLGEVNHLAID